MNDGYRVIGVTAQDVPELLENEMTRGGS